MSLDRSKFQIGVENSAETPMQSSEERIIFLG
jgi:hypothetical protein